ncbi:hypothetical protein QVD99_002908 [Batrachochytrium dendrobatidis]|nr:hypothetical protein O5D80_003199 [Batrachochytrium dendrobatidis]KAK5671147.1 hypothetical protein QVD99_002908 [Batrachochytrium dendrobatidis]
MEHYLLQPALLDILKRSRRRRKLLLKHKPYFLAHIVSVMVVMFILQLISAGLPMLPLATAAPAQTSISIFIAATDVINTGQSHTVVESTAMSVPRSTGVEAGSSGQLTATLPHSHDDQPSLSSPLGYEQSSTSLITTHESTTVSVESTTVSVESITAPVESIIDQPTLSLSITLPVIEKRSPTNEDTIQSTAPAPQTSKPLTTRLHTPEVEPIVETSLATVSISSTLQEKPVTSKLQNPHTTPAAKSTTHLKFSQVPPVEATLNPHSGHATISTLIFEQTSIIPSVTISGVITLELPHTLPTLTPSVVLPLDSKTSLVIESFSPTSTFLPLPTSGPSNLPADPINNSSLPSATMVNHTDPTIDPHSGSNSNDSHTSTILSTLHDISSTSSATLLPSAIPNPGPDGSNPASKSRILPSKSIASIIPITSRLSQATSAANPSSSVQPSLTIQSSQSVSSTVDESTLPSSTTSTPIVQVVVRSSSSRPRAQNNSPGGGSSGGGSSSGNSNGGSGPTVDGPTPNNNNNSNSESNSSGMSPKVLIPVVVGCACAFALIVGSIMPYVKQTKSRHLYDSTASGNVQEQGGGVFNLNNSLGLASPAGSTSDNSPRALIPLFSVPGRAMKALKPKHKNRSVQKRGAPLQLFGSHRFGAKHSKACPDLPAIILAPPPLAAINFRDDGSAQSSSMDQYMAEANTHCIGFTSEPIILTGSANLPIPPKGSSFILPENRQYDSLDYDFGHVGTASGSFISETGLDCITSFSSYESLFKGRPSFESTNVHALQSYSSLDPSQNQPSLKRSSGLDPLQRASSVFTLQSYLNTRRESFDTNVTIESLSKYLD